MFKDIEDKENYFIQPYIDGKKCIVEIYSPANEIVKIKAYTSNKVRIKLDNTIKKELSNSYKTSKYFKYKIFLLCFLTNDKNNKTILNIYDILLENEYNLYTQSKRYKIRHENIILRFINLKSKSIKGIFNLKYSEENLNSFIEQFIKTNVLDKIIFRKNSSFDNDSSIIEENVTTYKNGNIVGFKQGIVIKREFNDKQEVISELEVPCVDYLKVADSITNEVLEIKLNNFSDSDKVLLLSNIDDYLDKECVYKTYNILNFNGNIFCNLKK